MLCKSNVPTHVSRENMAKQIILASVNHISSSLSGKIIIYPQGFEAKIFATKLGLYTIANTDLFPSNQRNLFYALLYLTSTVSTWAKPITCQLFKGA